MPFILCRSFLSVHFVRVLKERRQAISSGQISLATHSTGWLDTEFAQTASRWATGHGNILATFKNKPIFRQAPALSEEHDWHFELQICIWQQFDLDKILKAS